jgi:hypothetical protein
LRIRVASEGNAVGVPPPAMDALRRSPANTRSSTTAHPPSSHRRIMKNSRNRSVRPWLNSCAWEGRTKERSHATFTTSGRDRTAAVPGSRDGSDQYPTEQCARGDALHQFDYWCTGFHVGPPAGRASESGFSDIRVEPRDFVIHAKDQDGNPVAMRVSPDSITAITEEGTKFGTPSKLVGQFWRHSGISGFREF